ncbi:uncharacterized protein BEWA_031070 [Theileria equi strain WA]|uniref:Membrane protein, putative n=1 Tax=Theileria equi strain WA TaxID=1537102 RepID=L0AZC1_THEEQ|nr:uncharacterized protein BEWA_031070 [Theileria equi strain WA]AFZ80254.1 membrane protein, putative [Theileria equi strain WA]|eukprot:XP_004829920.1 uncharacterized protein BEWA_031070 [Theileria equi strain WA]
MAVTLLSPALYVLLNFLICQLYPGVKTFLYLYGEKLPSSVRPAQPTVHSAVYAHYIVYWSVYVLYSFVDALLGRQLAYFPFFYEVKLTFFYWLGSENFKGAGFLFQRYGVKRLTSLKNTLIKNIESRYGEKFTATVIEFLGKLGTIGDLEPKTQE